MASNGLIREEKYTSQPSLTESDGNRGKQKKKPCGPTEIEYMYLLHTD
jgi:hypothetical protein